MDIGEDAGRRDWDQQVADLWERFDTLDGAVRAFLALALVDAGREREAVATALDALLPHLPRYRRSPAAYADGLRPR